jgi:hypothetical protein
VCACVHVPLHDLVQTIVWGVCHLVLRDGVYMYCTGVCDLTGLGVLSETDIGVMVCSLHLHIGLYRDRNALGAKIGM